jgi:pantoate--beta-alanine ligase
MTADLNMGVQIVAVPTMRDGDGLALSSRNAYLTDDERARALSLPRALQAAADAIEDGEPVNGAISDARKALDDSGFAPIDYVALVDDATLEPLHSPAGRMRLIAAATIGRTRLIDNVPVDAPEQG